MTLRILTCISLVIACIYLTGCRSSLDIDTSLGQAQPSQQDVIGAS